MLAGHSSGGLYTGVYNDTRSVIAGRVFLSPLMTSRTAFQVWFDSASERDEARARAEVMVAEGHGERLLPLPTWYYAISARSLLERIAEPDDYFAQGLRGWSSPVLGVWGGREGRVDEWARVFGGLDDRPCQTVTIPGAGHHYTGYEARVVDVLRDFLVKLDVEVSA